MEPKPVIDITKEFIGEIKVPPKIIGLIDEVKNIRFLFS